MLPLYTCRRSKRHQSSSPWTTNYPSRCATAMPMVPLDAYDQGASNAPSCEWNSAVSLSLSKVRSQNPPNPPFPDFFAGFFLFCQQVSIRICTKRAVEVCVFCAVRKGVLLHDLWLDHLAPLPLAASAYCRTGIVSLLSVSLSLSQSFCFSPLSDLTIFCSLSLSLFLSLSSHHLASSPCSGSFSTVSVDFLFILAWVIRSHHAR